MDQRPCLESIQESMLSEKLQDNELLVSRWFIVPLLIFSMVECMIGVAGALSIAFEQLYVFTQIDYWLIIVSTFDVLSGILGSLGFIILISKNTDKKIGYKMQWIHVNKLITFAWTCWQMVHGYDGFIFVQIHFYKLLMYIVILILITITLYQRKKDKNNFKTDQELMIR